MKYFQGKFKNINENGLKLLEPLYDDLEFLKLCKVNDNNPLDSTKTLTELKSEMVAVDDSYGLFVLRPFKENIKLHDNTQIYFYPATGGKSGGRTSSYMDYYHMSVVIPDEYWVLRGQGKWRAFSIAEIIAKHIDGKPIAGLGTTEIVEWSSGYIKGMSSHGTLNLTIRVQNGSSY